MATSRIPIKRLGRPYRVRQRDRRHEDGRGDGREEEHSFRRIGRRQLAGEEQIEAVAEHRADREEDGRLDALRARAGDDDHADEADRDRRPAPRSDPFAEQRAGETGDDEGAGEGDGRGLGELQVAERQKVEDRRQGEEQASRQLQEWAPRQVERPLAPRPERQQRDDHGPGIAGENDLHHRHRPAGIFRRRVEAGEHQEREAIEPDRPEPSGDFASR